MSSGETTVKQYRKLSASAQAFTVRIISLTVFFSAHANQTVYIGNPYLQEVDLLWRHNSEAVAQALLICSRFDGACQQLDCVLWCLPVVNPLLRIIKVQNVRR